MKFGNILFLVLPIALVVLLFNSQRKRGRQAATLQEQVAPGARICTTSGMFGTVVSMTDTDFVLEAAPGVHLRFDRRAIGLVVPSDLPASASGAAEPVEPDHTDGHDHPA